MTPTQIGSELDLDKRTTQRRIKDLRETLGAETTVAAVITAIRIGLIEQVTQAQPTTSGLSARGFSARERSSPVPIPTNRLDTPPCRTRPATPAPGFIRHG